MIGESKQHDKLLDAITISVQNERYANSIIINKLC